MSQPRGAPEARYETLVATLLRESDATIGPPGKRGFGGSALCIRGKIFAMLARGQLVVKLPATRVTALVEADAGAYYDPRHDGRLMREWLVASPALDGEWLTLAREALGFVASHG